MITELQHRGHCRLMLRIPAWRAEFCEGSDPDFLDVCEAYELAWRGLMVAEDIGAGKLAVEYREMVDWLEIEAVTLALWTRNRRAI